MTVDCWIKFCVSWLPSRVLVGASAAVTINSTQIAHKLDNLNVG